MDNKLCEKICLRLFDYLWTYDDLKKIFPNLVELTKEEFLLLNTPPLCYKKNQRHKELLRIIYTKTYSFKKFKSPNSLT